LALRPDLGGNLVRVAVHELGTKQLYRQRAGIAFLGELLQDRPDGCNTVTRDQPVAVVGQLRRRVEHILEMNVRELARLEQVELLELAETGPEVEEVEHRPDVRMRGLAHHAKRRSERREMRRRA